VVEHAATVAGRADGGQPHLSGAGRRRTVRGEALCARSRNSSPPAPPRPPEPRGRRVRPRGPDAAAGPRPAPGGIPCAQGASSVVRSPPRAPRLARGPAVPPRRARGPVPRPRPRDHRRPGSVLVDTGLAVWRAPLAGRLRRVAAAPATGDFVAVVDGGGPVRGVLPRRGVIARRGDGGRPEVLAANVDLALLATSLNRDLNPRRLARFLAITARGGTAAAVLLTKSDLMSPAEVESVLDEVRAGLDGVPALAVSVVDGDGLPAVRALLEPRRTAVLLGTSGVGKSSLLNALLGSARQATQPIRAGTTGAGTRRCAGSSSRCRAGRCSSTRPGCGSSPRPRRGDAPVAAAGQGAGPAGAARERAGVPPRDLPRPAPAPARTGRSAKSGAERGPLRRTDRRRPGSGGRRSPGRRGARTRAASAASEVTTCRARPAGDRATSPAMRSSAASGPRRDAKRTSTPGAVGGGSGGAPSNTTSTSSPCCAAHAPRRATSRGRLPRGRATTRPGGSP
jgi:ethanolamine utilization protein EutP (predicted NTPase)